MQMFRTLFLSLLFQAVSCCILFAQDKLPDIIVKNINNKIIVKWRNEYPGVTKTINIQRSIDSLKHFSTIGSVADPQKKENEFIDTKPPFKEMYYKVFVAFEGGNYVFSKTVRAGKPDHAPDLTKPVKTTIIPVPVNPVERIDSINLAKLKKINPVPVTVKPGKPINAPEIKKIEIPEVPLAMEKPLIPDKLNPHESLYYPMNHLSGLYNHHAYMYPSNYIYTGKENNIIVSLPGAGTKKYLLRFFNDNNKLIFELDKLFEQSLIIEKVNFLHSGWFKFELLENGKLFEKNSFYIPGEDKIHISN